MDYDNVDANLSFRAKIVNGQDTWTFHSSKQPGVRRIAIVIGWNESS